MQWLNEPLQWSQSDRQIHVKTSPKTDFWRTTHYGFIRDSGHFYFDTVSGDFDVEVYIQGAYTDLYDQAGLMLRIDEKNWIKTGIEYVEGVQYVSAVVTQTYSDWSVAPLHTPPEKLYLRLERRQEAVHIWYKPTPEDEAILLRLAYFPIKPEVQAGLMCASPDGHGYDVTFEDYRLTAK